MTQARPDVSLFFPVYRDERTVRRVTEKSLRVLKELAGEYEVVIVDDGSPDRSGEIADELAQEHASVRVVHHARNLGYGEAIKTGLREVRYEWICLTDGDDEYDVSDLAKLIHQYIVGRIRKTFTLRNWDPQPSADPAPTAIAPESCMRQ